MLVVASILSSALAAWILLRGLYPLSYRIGLLDRPDRKRKRHERPVPLIGGIAIYGGILAGSLWWLPLSSSHLFMLLGAGLLVALGAFDDRFKLGVGVRFLGQSMSALLMIFGADVQLDSFGNLLGNGPVVLGALAVPLTLIAIVGMINAFNMIDGMDGLAGGLTLIALGSLLMLPGVPGTSLILLVPLCAALLPFMVYNLGLFGCAGRQVFLGDSGSMLLGYLVAWAMIVSSQGSGSLMTPVLALWLVAIPLLDTLGTIARRIRRGTSPFEADNRHLHHYLLRILGRPKTVLLAILACAAFMASITMLAALRSVHDVILFYLFVITWCIYFAALGRLPGLVRWSRRARRRIAPRMEAVARETGSS